MSVDRYESEQEIMVDIEKTHRRINRYKERAAGYEASNRMLAQQTVPDVTMMDINKSKMEYCVQMVSQLTHGRLAVLGEKLSEFRTMQFKGEGFSNDPSIPKLVRKSRKKQICPPVAVPSSAI